MRQQRSAITIFDVQPLKALHLPKDVGLLPRSIAERSGRGALLIAVQGKERIARFPEEGRGKLELRAVPQRFGHGESVASLWYALNALSVARALAAEARSSRLLLLFHPHPAVLLYSLVFRLLNPRGKIWLKLDMDDGGLEDFKRKRTRLRLYFLSVDIVTVETEANRRKLNRHWRGGRKVICVPDGYDAVLHPVPEGALEGRRGQVFLTVGRLGTRQKNNECFLDAISLLGPGNGEFRFIGECEPEFRARVEGARKASGRDIRLLDRIDDREALFRHYEEARVFVLTSRYESFGIVLVEAMAHGCYLVSTDLSSARDIIGGDESVGLIVPQEDPEALAAALRRASAMKIDYAAIARKARRFYYENIVRGLPWVHDEERGGKTQG